MSYVFLSYAREDLHRVTQLRKTLEEEGIEVWMDVDGIAGEVWRDGINNKLQSAACVLVCWSNISITRTFVRDEGEQAKKKYTLIPVCIDPVQQPLGFGEIQMLNLSQWPPSPESKQKLLQAVRHKLTPRPTVLIASTLPDLGPYREQARSAAHALDFTALLSDDSTDAPVSQANLVVVIVAHRYSANVRNALHSAQKQGKQVLAFLLDPEHTWPAEHKEDYRCTAARRNPDLLNLIDRDIDALEEFKAELAACKATKFTDPASIRESMIKDLKEYAEKNQGTLARASPTTNSASNTSKTTRAKSASAPQKRNAPSPISLASTKSTFR